MPPRTEFAPPALIPVPIDACHQARATAHAPQLYRNGLDGAPALFAVGGRMPMVSLAAVSPRPPLAKECHPMFFDLMAFFLESSGLSATRASAWLSMG